MTRRAVRTVSLTDRDIRTLKLIGRLRLVATRHVKALIFPDTTFGPLYTSLRRLIKAELVSVAARQIVEPGRGGSGQNVYHLTPRGFDRLYIGEYSKPRMSDAEHTLAIADAVVTLYELAGRGKFGITAILTEPECHRDVAGYRVEPDLFIELSRDGKSKQYWLEVERSEKGKDRLLARMRNYHNVYRHVSESEMPDWIWVIWVAIHPETAERLRGLIRQLPGEAQNLFRVITLSELSTKFG
jgi:hypothetical protein